MKQIAIWKRPAKHIERQVPWHKKIKLYGIDDDMSFITPDKYDVSNFEEIIKE